MVLKSEIINQEPPEAHPMWPAQVELERGMLREGADRVRDRVVQARERGQMTRVDAVRGLLDDWLPKVAEGVREWVRVMGKSRGPKPIALPYLQACDPYVAALVALRAVLDGVTVERAGVMGLAVEIGRSMEHEQQVRMWEAEEPELFWSVQRGLDRQDATATHRARVNINRFNALLAEGRFAAGWQAWGEEVQFRVGIALLDAVIRETSWFELRPDPSHVWKQGRKKGPKLVLAAKPGLVEWLGRQLDDAEVMHPAYTPTVVPPRRWEGTRSGGYWTPYVKTPRLIRFKANQEDQKDRAADEYEALDMPKVYSALHTLQEVPWRVNRRVLEVADAAVSRDLGLGKLPVASEIPLPPRPAAMLVPETDPMDDLTAAVAAAPVISDRQVTGKRTKRPAPRSAAPAPVTRDELPEVKQWKRAAANVYARNAKRLSKVRGVSRTLRIAKTYREFDRFYFPHMMDFRGRMYPIPVGLQPQGDDLARGLLEFAEGKPVTEENGGAAWLSIHLASTWGNDKWDFERRMDWVDENEALWRRIAGDPLGNTEWSRADKPWQALAAVLDWVGFLDHGFGYVSHAAVAVDGTCNGIQHLSAMTRDEVAGEYVNLVPGEAPKDIYKFVASGLQETLERLEADGVGDPAEHASYWLDLCGRDLPRSLTKRQVMVLPYGGTKDSFYTYTRAWLDEHDPMPLDLPEEETQAIRELRVKRLSFLVGHLWDAVNDKVRGAMVVMKWLQDCARSATTGNQPIFWVTASGFVVRHFYGKQVERDVTVMLDGHRKVLKQYTTTKDLDVQSQLQGISPNFVHSQDAAALCLTINAAAEDGITGFTAVHDAYGTHAADMWALFRHLRAAFVEVHEGDVLAGFRAACHAILVDLLLAERADLDPLAAAELADETLRANTKSRTEDGLPEKGRLDLKLVAESRYFFA